MKNSKKTAKKSSKKKAVKRSVPKKAVHITPATGLFLVVPPYEKVGAVYEEDTNAVIGPMSEKEAIEAIDRTVKDGCERSKLTVISGRKMSLKMRLA